MDKGATHLKTAKKYYMGESEGRKGKGENNVSIL